MGSDLPGFGTYLETRSDVCPIRGSASWARLLTSKPEGVALGALLVGDGMAAKTNDRVVVVGVWDDRARAAEPHVGRRRTRPRRMRRAGFLGRDRSQFGPRVVVAAWGSAARRRPR